MFTFNPNKSNPNFILISSLFALLLLCSIICIVAGETSSVLNKSKKEIQKDSNFWQALEELAEKRFDFSAGKRKKSSNFTNFNHFNSR